MFANVLQCLCGQNREKTWNFFTVCRRKETEIVEQTYRNFLKVTDRYQQGILNSLSLPKLSGNLLRKTEMVKHAPKKTHKRYLVFSLHCYTLSLSPPLGGGGVALLTQHRCVRVGAGVRETYWRKETSYLAIIWQNRSSTCFMYKLFVCALPRSMPQGQDRASIFPVAAKPTGNAGLQRPLPIQLRCSKVRLSFFAQLSSFLHNFLLCSTFQSFKIWVKV